MALFYHSQVKDWVRSWPKVHPTWKYWFWTADGALDLIDKKFNKYLNLYENYPYKINRADARRFFIIYEYGGIYTDLDMESIQPLDDLLENYTCIISQEPEEHQTLLYHNEAPNYALTGFFACRPRHPFFRFLIDMLPDFATRAVKLTWNDNILKSTGPAMVAEVLDLYQRQNRSTGEGTVTLAPPKWFMPTFDFIQKSGFEEKCSNVSQLTEKQIILCSKLKKTGYKNEPGPEAYTDHHWLHTWGYNFVADGNIPIDVLVPKATIIDG